MSEGNRDPLAMGEYPSHDSAGMLRVAVDRGRSL